MKYFAPPISKFGAFISIRRVRTIFIKNSTTATRVLKFNKDKD